MSNSYPSRRELRLQREREERATLRDQEAQRWAEEVEDRQQRAVETQRQADETLAKADPVPASDATEPSNTNTFDDEPEQTAQNLQMHGAGRRAAAGPVDVPADSEEPTDAVIVPRRRRRADSQVTSTGMLPVITKHRDDEEQPKPRSRREAREQAAREAAERNAEIEALQRQQAEQQEPVEQKPRRRATSPQAPPPPVAATVDATTETDDDFDVDSDDDIEEEPIVLSTSELYGESAVEITDMSGMDTIEIRRAELRAETEKLTQEIIALGQENPNVIDPLLLRRQKELAEKSQELQDLETSAVTIIEDDAHYANASDEQASPDTGTTLDTAHNTNEEPAAHPPAGSDTTDTNSTSHEPSETEPDMNVSTETAADSDSAATDGIQPARRSRRASSGPVITGPFEVSEDENEPVEAAHAESKPDFATHFEPQPDTETLSTTGPERPLDASSAHGLDTLDPKESEAPERRLLTISIIVFAIGILALITAIILLTR